MDKSLCDFIKEIQKDPLKKLDNLTVGKFYALKSHFLECSPCAAIVDEVCEKYKDVPSDPNSEWNKAKYN